jgi:hypothetical protein
MKPYQCKPSFSLKDAISTYWNGVELNYQVYFKLEVLIFKLRDEEKPADTDPAKSN